MPQIAVVVSIVPELRAPATPGESLAAFDGRCIHAPPHRAGKRAAGTPALAALLRPQIRPGILGCRALPARRLARLGATPDFHHGLLGSGSSRAASRDE